MTKETKEERAARIQNKGLIIGAIITGFCAILAAVIAGLFGFNPFQERASQRIKTTEPTNTPISSLQPTITPISLLEPITTQIQLPEPTVTPLPSATPEVYFFDDFSSKSKYPWDFSYLATEGTVTTVIEQGVLRVTIICPMEIHGTNCTPSIPIPIVSKNNFKISFDIKYEQLTNGASISTAILFRKDSLNGNYYYAQYLFSGQCSLDEYYGGHTTNISKENIGFDYQPVVNNIYKYSLLAKNDSFILYVEDNKIISEVNGDINVNSPILLRFYVSKGSNAIISVDNLRIENAP